MNNDLKEFVALLNEHGVKYLIVGGYAVAFHGHPRYTGDIDVFISRDPENARKVMTVLDSFGFGGLNLTDADFQSPDSIVQLGFPPNRIDIITTISGVTFDQAWPSRQQSILDGVAIPFISKGLLLINKRSAGRTKDKLDADQLD